MNFDPVVMEFFPAFQGRAASDASIDSWQSQFASQGWSNWAVELEASGQFVGFVGLTVPRRILPFSPCVEIGWRLARSVWGQGFATEAARATLRVGFEHLALPEIVSFTASSNQRSRAIMERIGMRNADEGHHRLRCHHSHGVAKLGNFTRPVVANSSRSLPNRCQRLRLP